ncbi:MAG: RNA polymerase sigma factor SigJ [Pseudomonadota bacterium]
MTATDTFEAQRPALTALCYRMLGERAAAEDAVQDTWLRWAAADHAAIRTPAAWLRTTATRIAIDALRRAKTRRDSYVGPWLPEPLIADTTPEDHFARAQECELALLWVMDTLGPTERAAFILREAFDAPYPEIAATLNRSEAACRQLVSRAHRRVAQAGPDLTQPSDRRAAQLSGFLAAIASDDLEAAKAFIAPDAIALSDGGSKARAARRPLVGVDEIVAVSRSVTLKHAGVLNIHPVIANGQPALLLTENGNNHSLLSAALDANGLIRWLYTMRNPDKLMRDGGRGDVRSTSGARRP